ncbi:MAG: hypothetical protein EON55_03845 [Alphaproteobacteria bacterium]|nr:MAG: hypothetical protein EON55_03845 [Alphaproteobacteria bacterium]
MRKLVLVAPCLFLLGACTSTANVPPIVSWSYGAGNGDGVKYPGPPPKYSFNYGAGSDVPVTSGAHPQMSYGYGGDGVTGSSVQMVAPEKQQLAAPAPRPNPNTHS